MVVFWGVMPNYQSNCYAQDNQSSQVMIYFHTGKSNISSDFMQNGTSLETLNSIFQKGNIPNIQSVDIKSYVSPEGPARVNNKLLQERTEAVKQYIVNHYPDLPEAKIASAAIGVNWELLRDLVEKDQNTPSREKVLRILDSTTGHSYAPKNRIIALQSGSWNYMLKNLFPLLRVATIISVTQKPKAPEPVAEVAQPAEVAPETIEFAEITETETVMEYDSIARKPLFALKTNLLYDAATALNAEIEIPIGKRWSIAAEYIFPWWLWKKKQIALESLSGNLEGRYWFGNREKRDVMTGWFAGVYGGGGYYDLEWKKKGYQGEFYSVGLTGGFTHKISRNLRMEYSLGLGYIGTKYRKYQACYSCEDGDWNLQRISSGNNDWIGPTRLKISLVWMLNKKYIVKGNK